MIITRKEEAREEYEDGDEEGESVDVEVGRKGR